MAKRYDPILCMMVDKPDKAQDELSLAQKKQVVTELKGYLKKSYNFSDESEYARAYEDLRHMFTTGSRKSISGLFENTVKKTGAHDAKAHDESYIVRGRKYKVVKRDGDNVTVIGPDGKVTKMHIDFLMSEGKKVSDSASALDEAIKTADASNIDIDHIANYLWTWENGSDVARQLFFEGLEKYPGPHTPEHKDPAYKFAADYASKELNNVYSKLKSAVDKKLKSGYEKSKQNLNNLKNG